MVPERFHLPYLTLFDLLLKYDRAKVILIDATRDLRLAEIKSKAETLLEEFPHLETKIR